LDQGQLMLYPHWAEVAAAAKKHVANADVALVTSFCPDGAMAADLILDTPGPIRVFYDLDTPVTLAALESGDGPAYLPRRGLSGFDLVLSYTGGRALDLLRQRLGARHVAPLYGHVDPQVHHPSSALPEYQSALSYLGTYSPDRQAAVDELFIQPARKSPGQRFVLGGPMYPDVAAWPRNLVHFPHISPQHHAAFYSSSRLTLNVTRGTMARLGHCPSGRLFEAAACGVGMVSDWFEGLDAFFTPETDLLVAHTHHEVEAALSLDDTTVASMAERARQRVLSAHTAHHRVLELEELLTEAALRG
jgi:spore maturation protein CgeB